MSILTRDLDAEGLVFSIFSTGAVESDGDELTEVLDWGKPGLCK